MNCPKCKTETLSAATIRGVEVDRCAACGGIWFDSGELDEVLSFPRSALKRMEAKSEDPSINQIKGNCPRDNAQLLRVYSAANETVIVDTCPDCSGIWLDGGELSKLGQSARY